MWVRAMQILDTGVAVEFEGEVSITALCRRYWLSVETQQSQGPGSR